jgi:hypothetical protein
MDKCGLHGVSACQLLCCLKARQGTNDAASSAERTVSCSGRGILSLTGCSLQTPSLAVRLQLTASPATWERWRGTETWNWRAAAAKESVQSAILSQRGPPRLRNSRLRDRTPAQPLMLTCRFEQTLCTRAECMARTQQRSARQRRSAD